MNVETADQISSAPKAGERKVSAKRKSGSSQSFVDTHLPRAGTATNTSQEVEPGRAIRGLMPKVHEPSPALSSPVTEGGSGHSVTDTHYVGAGAANSSRSHQEDADHADGAADQVGGGQVGSESHTCSAAPDLRFDDPLVASIVQQHRTRRRWMKARNALVLQGKAVGRSLHDGDKEAGTAAFERVAAGKIEPGDEALSVTLIPFLAGIAAFDEHLKRTEADLAKLAKQLPVAAWVDSVPGFGLGSLAAIVGECGDIGQYRTVSGVWRRLGLAPYKGKAGKTWNVPKWRDGPALTADEWSEFGYSGERRSVAWNAAEPIARAQREWKGEGLTKSGKPKKSKPAGPYGLFLEAEKAKALDKGWTPGHAEAHARRVMFKRVLRDLWVAWRAADRNQTDTQKSSVGSPINSNESGHACDDALRTCAALTAEAA